MKAEANAHSFVHLGKAHFHLADPCMRDSEVAEDGIGVVGLLQSTRGHSEDKDMIADYTPEHWELKSDIDLEEGPENYSVVGCNLLTQDSLVRLEIENLIDYAVHSCCVGRNSARMNPSLHDRNLMSCYNLEHGYQYLEGVTVRVNCAAIRTGLKPVVRAVDMSLGVPDQYIRCSILVRLTNTRNCCFDSNTPLGIAPSKNSQSIPESCDGPKTRMPFLSDHLDHVRLMLILQNQNDSIGFDYEVFLHLTSSQPAVPLSHHHLALHETLDLLRSSSQGRQALTVFAVYSASRPKQHSSPNPELSIKRLTRS